MLEPLFRRGAAQGAVVFEPGFAERLGARPAGRLLIITDATEPNTGSVVAGLRAAVIQGYERERGAAQSGAVRIVPAASACASTRRARARTCSCPG